MFLILCCYIQVAAAELMSRTLRFSVYDVDKRRVRHSLGHVFEPLEDADLTGTETVWRELEPMSQVGQILIYTF